MWTVAVFLLVAIAGAVAVRWGLQQIQPMLRRKVVETLSVRFHSPVELDRLSLSMNRGVIVTGGGLRILYLAGPTKPDARPNAPPMLVVDSFEFGTEWRELLRPTTRVVSVKVRGLQVNIPPKEERSAMPDDPKRRGQPVIGIAVDRIECTDAKVVIETSKPEKKPLEFAIRSLVLTDVGAKQPFNYEALLVNPKPVGDVGSKGRFGPWQNDNPRDTPLDGSYEFTHADLSSIHGIGGVLSSTGTFGGTLGNLAVEGVTDTPDFRLDVSDHGMPLHTEFTAVVDGTTGDTVVECGEGADRTVGVDGYGCGDPIDDGAGTQYGSACGDGEGADRRHAGAFDEGEPNADARRAGDEGACGDSAGAGERVAEDSA